MGKAGEEYGWLTILGEGARTKRNRRTIHVRCRCGKEYDVQAVLLRRSVEPKCRSCSNAIKSKLRHGTPDYQFKIEGTTAIGTLPSGDQFIIDAEDIPLVSQRHWYKKADQKYIISDTKEKGRLIERIRLHRYLMGLSADDECVIDHINRDSMDCRKSNMRIATQSQNCLNKSIRSDNSLGFIGVRHVGRYYYAQIWIANTFIRVGRSNDPVACAQMYNCAAQILHGEFVGELNDVPFPSQEIWTQVENQCRPYLGLAEQVTTSCKSESTRIAV